MVFRDDREALRARAEAAERRLAEREREIEALRRGAAARESVPPPPDVSPPPLPSSSWSGRYILGGALTLAVAGGIAYLFIAGSAADWPQFERTGRVASTTGDAPVPVGSVCTLQVRPTSGTYNCRVRVECNGAVIYGGVPNMGFTSCATDARGPTRARDPRGTATEGDPLLELDLPAGRVVVADDAPRVYSVGIILDAPAAPR